MSSATRVQFKSVGTTPSQLATPSKAASTALSIGLQALHESLRDNEVITGLAQKFLKLFILSKSKESTLRKFDDDTFIPTSCRIKVDLKGSYRISASDEFAVLTTRLKDITDAFKRDTANVFKASAELELKLIKQELSRMVLSFSDLLIKQKLLTKNDCRDHSLSKELITAVFIQEPRNHARTDIEAMIVDDTPGALEDIIGNIDTLRFNADDDFIYAALSIPEAGSSQPSAMTNDELVIVNETKKDLKRTLYHVVRSFHVQERKIYNSTKTKEVLLETLTGEVANGTAIEINNDSNNNQEGTKLPDDVESLRDLIGSVMLEKMNSHKISQKKSKNDLKDPRGARGGGASSKTNTPAQKKKKDAQRKKKAAAAKAAKKKANRAAAAARDSVVADSNKRRRPTERSS